MLKLKGYKPKKISEVAEILKNESDVVRAFLSEAVKLVKLVQSQPTSAASAEPLLSEESEDVPPVYTDTSGTNAPDGHKHEQDLFRQFVYRNL